MKIKEKTWTKEMEKVLYEKWKKEEKFKFRPDHRQLFSIDTPPPYVNAPVHIGHAATYTLMDMFARFHRMKGHNVLFPLGLDRNGLPIEVATEKRFGVNMLETSREEFIELCKKVLEEASAESMDSFLKLGISFNSWKVGRELGDIYLTDSKEYRTLTQATFIDMWKMGLIYEDNRVNNYCPGCRTTIADAEIDYDEKETLFSDIIFKVRETGEELIISTTRPELVCTCAMVVFHPDDERYRHLEGKTAVTSVFKKEVPIMPHPVADPEKGSGLMMMCAFGDQNDIRFFRELKIKPVIAIDEKGEMNENAGFLRGMGVKEARQKMLEELKKEGLLVSQRRITHRTPICERSKDPIEFIEMKEFYLKQIDVKADMKKRADEMNFFADRSRQILHDWIDSIGIDWPISRRRYYATEIPLWYCDCGYVIVPEKGRYYQPWKESPPIKSCPQCGSGHFRGEERVFDTWFDSANSELFILKMSENDEFFRANYPCTLRPQGREIIRTWLYYTVLKAHYLTGKAPFRDVWINYYIIDEKGKKMSKSLGNIIDPHVILEKFGAEPFRLWCALEGNLEKSDLRCSFERIEGAGKTLTKLWNIAKFVSLFEEPVAEVTEPTDKWIINELNRVIKEAEEGYEKYDFHTPAASIRHFLWETFASHYLELVKNRAYNQSGKFTEGEQKSALFTLHHCLRTILKLLAPVTPFVTHDLYNDLYGKDVQEEHFPKPIVPEDIGIQKEDIIEINNAIWKAKKDKNQSLKAEVKHLVLPEKFQPMEKDIAATHSVLKLTYGHLKVEV